MYAFTSRVQMNARCLFHEWVANVISWSRHGCRRDIGEGNGGDSTEPEGDAVAHSERRLA